MELPKGFKEVIQIKLRHNALEDLVYETWGKRYDVAAALDFPNNDSYFEYDIGEDTYEGDYMLDQGKSPVYENEYDGWFDLQRVVERLEASNWLTPGPIDVLTALCETGKLPAGKYLLTYWW